MIGCAKALRRRLTGLPSGLVLALSRMICRAPLSRGIAHYASRLIPRGLIGPPAGGIAGIYAQKEPKRAGESDLFGGPIQSGRQMLKFPRGIFELT